jgi:hypothetical protein
MITFKQRRMGRVPGIYQALGNDGLVCMSYIYYILLVSIIGRDANDLKALERIEG